MNADTKNMTMSFMKKYRSRLTSEMTIHRDDNSFYTSEISDLDRCIESLCETWYNHNWTNDEFEVGGEILNVTICTICDSIKS